RTPRQRWFHEGLGGFPWARGREETRPAKSRRSSRHSADRARPRPFRARAQASFVVSIVEGPAPEAEVLPALYPFIVRTLGNMVLYLLPDGDGVVADVVTLEQSYLLLS